MWDVRVCDVAALGCIFNPMGLDSSFVEWGSETVRRGFRFEGDLYSEFEGVLRAYPSNSSMLELQNLCWEVKHGDIVDEVLKALFRIPSHIEYEYSVVDSTKITDWLKGLHELFVNVEG
jgi:hypothetical protein